MKIMITGAAGFIGSHTADLCQAKRNIVLAVDDYSTGRIDNLLDFCAPGKNGALVHEDITDFSAMAKLFQKFEPDVVIHLAAQAAISTSIQDPMRDCTVNTMGTIHLATLCKARQIRLVYSSTSAVYSPLGFIGKYKEDHKCEPNSPYGISKLAAEHYIRTMLPTNHIILRYGNVYGPRQRPIGQNQVIARMLRHFLNGDEFYIFGDGEDKRDYIYVSDVAYANYLAATSSVISGTFNVGSGYSTTVNQLARNLNSMFDVNYKWDHKEIDVPSRRNVCLNASKMRDTFGWSPSVGLAAGLHYTAEFWEKP